VVHRKAVLFYKRPVFCPVGHPAKPEWAMDDSVNVIAKCGHEADSPLTGKIRTKAKSFEGTSFFLSDLEAPLLRHIRPAFKSSADVLPVRLSLGRPWFAGVCPAPYSL